MCILIRLSLLCLCVPSLLLLSLAESGNSEPTNKDIFQDGFDKKPLSEKSLRHIMHLVTLGTGIEIPHIPFRIRENTLKRARINTRTRPRTDYVIGSEFLGKRDSSSDYDNESPEKRMGSEFLGKRMGSEFLGKRMGSEFLGKRMGSEFLGKRMGSEFLGKRMGSEFLGKRMGSEFLGKRYHSSSSSEEIDNDSSLDQIQPRNDDDDDDNTISRKDDLQKRVGSEFLGRRKRSMFYEDDDHESYKTTESLSDPDEIYSRPWSLETRNTPHFSQKEIPDYVLGPGKRLSEFLGGPGKRLSEFLGGPGKRLSEFLGGPGKRLSEFLGGPGKRRDHESDSIYPSKRLSEFLGGPGKRSSGYPEYSEERNG